jgi:hypothetical protein
MDLNNRKYYIRVCELEAEVKEHLGALFSIEVLDIEAEIKYLGFILKPNFYGYVDWNWLVVKVQSRIDIWSNHFLSRGGTSLNQISTL